MTVTADEAEMRLDRWLRRHFPGLAQGRVEKLLRTGQVRVAGKRARAGHRLAAGDKIRLPPSVAPSPESSPSSPAGPAPSPVETRLLETVRAAILHMDADILALNKPPGLAVQGGTGTRHHLDALLDGLSFDSDERPRLVHRLDKDTSGVLLLARTLFGARHLAAAFRGRAARKIYWALVAGVPRPETGEITQALFKGEGSAGRERMLTASSADGDAKAARTSYRVMARAGNRVAWLALRPLTGRTHQLRAHAAALGTPIIGDRKYGRKALAGGDIANRLHLHSRILTIPHPRGGVLSLTAPLPPHMAKSWSFFGFDPEAGDPFPPDEGAD